MSAAVKLTEICDCQEHFCGSIASCVCGRRFCELSCMERHTCSQQSHFIDRAWVVARFSEYLASTAERSFAVTVSSDGSPPIFAAAEAPDLNENEARLVVGTTYNNRISFVMRFVVSEGSAESRVEVSDDR